MMRIPPGNNLFLFLLNKPPVAEQGVFIILLYFFKKLFSGFFY